MSSTRAVWRHLFLAAGTVALFLCQAVWSAVGGVDTKMGRGKEYYLPCQYAVFSDDAEYYLHSLQRAEARLQRVPAAQLCAGGVVRWGVVSHHLFVKELIADYFLRLSAEVHPRTVVLIGPNHFSRGNQPVATSALEWKTPFGMLSPDMTLLGELLHTRLAAIDDDAFYNEHSIGALVPFVKYCFPGVKVVPLIVRSDVRRETIDSLAQFLTARSNGAILPIASLDFSHYKTSAVAQQEDMKTFDIIQRLDADHCARAFVDSHPILSILLRSCKTLNASMIDVIHHTNSGIIDHRPEERCTSYMNLVFRSAWK